MKTWLKYLIIIVVLTVVGTLFFTKVYLPKNTFKTLSPTKGTLSVKVRGIGNVGAKDIYSITAQSGGKILALATDEGEWVKKGDLLVTMDGVDLSAQLEGAKASLQKSKYDIIAAEDELKNQLTKKALLRKTYERYEKLNTQGYAAQSEYDKAQSDLQGIETQIAASRSRINAAKAESRRAQKSIEAFEIKMSRLNVYAPVDGYVIAKEAESAQNVLPTTSIFKVVDPKTLWIITKIDERICAGVHKDQKATITLHSQPDKVFKGHIKRINAMSDAVTLEREIDVAFEQIPTPFYINEQAEVAIEVKRYDDVIKIPLNVVVQQNGSLGVWILQDNRAHFLKLENRAQSNTEMTAGNITEGMQIIVPDATKRALKEGMKIHL